MVQPDGAEHGRYFQRLAHARRATRNRDALHIGHESDAFPFDELNADVQVRGQPQWTWHRTIQFDMRDVVAQLFPEAIPQLARMLRALSELARRDLGGNPCSHDCGDILCARAATAFLDAAV